MLTTSELVKVDLNGKSSVWKKADMYAKRAFHRMASI